MVNATWSYPTAIRFGPGRLSELAAACGQAGISRPLFVTDPGVARLPITDLALGVLRSGGIHACVFSEVQANPTSANVDAGVRAYRSGGHDGVIAFGGGSAMDCAKCIAFQHGQSRPLWDFEDVGDWWTRADASVISPIVAVPTTAGTGSEVGRAAVITHPDTHDKKIIFHPRMQPVQVILDPELTIGLPPALTAGAGMDALAHCLEAYCAPTFHPMSEGIALEGMRLVKEALPRAVSSGSDIEARGQLLVAASMGAVAFQKGLGAIHSLSHPVGALFNTHHGMTNGVFMPYVLDFNRTAIEAKMPRLCALLGLSDGFSGGFDTFQAWVLELRAEIGVPHTLVELGLDGEIARDAERVADIARRAVADPSTGTNPVPLDEQGAAAIFLAAMEGRL